MAPQGQGFLRGSELNMLHGQESRGAAHSNAPLRNPIQSRVKPNIWQERTGLVSFSFFRSIQGSIGTKSIFNSQQKRTQHRSETLER